MAIHSDLHQAWVLFRAAVSAYCEPGAYSGTKNRAITEAEWHLGRFKTIVGTITSESLPGLNPAYLHIFRDFIASWDEEPDRMRKGAWEGRERLYVNSLALEATRIEDAILKVAVAEKAELAGNASPDAEVRWSRADTKTRHAGSLGISLKTFNQYVADGVIRVDKISDRRIRINLDDAERAKG